MDAIIHNLKNTKIAAINAPEIACPNFSISVKLPSAATRPITAPKTPNVGAYVPA